MRTARTSADVCFNDDRRFNNAFQYEAKIGNIVLKSIRNGLQNMQTVSFLKH